MLPVTFQEMVMVVQSSEASGEARRLSRIPPERRAVVVGGSMAGLLAARSLAGHFDLVTLIERDTFPDEAVFRKGVPQSRHLHVFLKRGLEIVKRMFPGIEGELLDAGAAPVRWPRDVLWLTPAGWSRRFDSGVDVLSASRELLEFAVRRRLAALPNVQFVEECDVTGLLPEGTGVAGVQVQRRGGDHARDDIRAGFVIDASGRDSHAPEWLERIGYARPDEIKINAFLGYATRRYAIPEQFAADWKVLFLQGKPPEFLRGAGLFPIEGNRWVVTLGGTGKDYPPTDDAGFLEFARSLRTPVLYEAIKDAEPVTPVSGYRRTENQMRRYDRLPHWPERFVVLGDAACAFNPIYGQGMSVAAIEALALHRALKQQRRRQPDGDLAGVARMVQRAIGKAAATAWLMATSEDLRYPTTEGGRANATTRLMHRYFDRLMSVSAENQRVNTAFGNVINLVEPPASLFRPDILLTALRGARRSESSGPPAAPREAETARPAAPVAI
jgi:2-polyprenyl-6-methoxyphenol hydroxylase-like FAD-dependent oxidoreductase